MCASFRSVSQFKPFLILAALITAETVLLLHTLSLYRQSLRSPYYTVTSTNLITQSGNLMASRSYHTLLTLKTLEVKLDKSLKPLQPKVTEQDVYLIQEIFASFSIAMNEASLTFFIYSGSLLGSWRHHGLVPWDDDLDVAVPLQQKDAMAKVLNGLKPHYLLDVTQGVRWKFFSARSMAINRVTWKWPFLDITFYVENKTHMWDQDKNFRDFIFNKEDVFPLYERPFMDIMLPAPRHTQAVLSRTYNLNVCTTWWYDHRGEKMINGELKSVPCEQLQQVFPFVRRQAAAGGHGGCNESLVLNGTVLAWVVLNAVEGPSDVVIREMDHVDSNGSSVVTLSCNTTGALYPGVNFTWSTGVCQNETHTARSSTCIVSLDTEDDRKSWTCTAINSVDSRISVSTSVTLWINGAGNVSVVLTTDSQSSELAVVGPVVGPVIGAVVAVVVIGAIAILLVILIRRRRRKLKKAPEKMIRSHPCKDSEFEEHINVVYESSETAGPKSSCGHNYRSRGQGTDSEASHWNKQVVSAQYEDSPSQGYYSEIREIVTGKTYSQPDQCRTINLYSN